MSSFSEPCTNLESGLCLLFFFFCSLFLPLSLFQTDTFPLREIINKQGLAECRQYYLLKQPEQPVKQLEAEAENL